MFKSKIMLTAFLCSLVFVLPLSVSAHPGRTDSNGGHTCRTNCEKWGLEYGEYHYHNGGGSNSGSSGSHSNSTSSNTTPSSKINQPVSEPKPKIDAKQVKADKHLKSARILYNSKDYKGTIKELDQIYELGKNSNQTDLLIQSSLSAIYQLAENAFDQNDYSKAKSYVTYIKEYKRSSKLINQKADVLLNQIKTNEKIEGKLSDATIARDNKEYKEAFKLVKEAQKISNVKKTKTFYNETVKALTKDAEMAYHKKQYKQVNTYYNLLISVTTSEKLKTKYKMVLENMEEEQLLRKSFVLDSGDLEGESLYTHLIDKKNETPFNEGVVNDIKSSLVEGVKDTMHFIYNINIKELFKGGKQDAA
ncbi:YHYH domain-containing protein [Rummeliibacillus stabekisii]|uniref:YHYH domain-containing protein n=1 Tax=Rummeliibacillus stabekisii TaxID=241244 RepID=UPI0011757350|nr:YHYH domain-containing protein [Rummeliibacillus stabekisii]MBB5171626.1 tetratricopeptide (TPR) repeat protein [Rummeliibacillus stabekisii]GEL05472.1 hypothetical protein RST01_20990 [Rummeliibacillus stabekisii]